MILGYWMIAVLLVTVILTSLDLSFLHSLMYGLVFIPEALLAKIMMPAPSPDGRIRNKKNILFIGLALLCMCLALIFAVSVFIYHMEGEYMVQDLGTPKALTNPAFLSAMIMLLLAGDYFMGRYIEKRFPAEDNLIDFISNRKKVQLKQSDIVYIESNDAEVWLHAADGTKYRNKTPIGQWETRLGHSFMRISRSHLVNRAHVTEICDGTVVLGSVRLASSKKYMVA